MEFAVQFLLLTGEEKSKKAFWCELWFVKYPKCSWDPGLDWLSFVSQWLEGDYWPTCIYFITLALHGFIIDTYWHSGDSIFVILSVISFLRWQSQARIKEGRGGLTASLKRFSHLRNIDSIDMNILAFGLIQILMYSDTGCEYLLSLEKNWND